MLRRLRSFVIRHRYSIRDLSIVLAFVGVLAFIAVEVDLFENEKGATAQELTVELDEALLLGAAFTVGLLIFATRRYLDQKRETARRIQAEQEVRRIAFQDSLTGLPNRRQFDDALKTALGSPPRDGAQHAVLLLDLNGFKQINDVHGHGTGDEVLMVVAQRLLASMRDGDLVARFGGDEFAILAPHVLGPEAATNVAKRVIGALESPIVIDRTAHRVGAGIGIALNPQDATSMEEILRKADVALYRAKAERRSALRFFEEHMDQQVAERDRMERDLRTAMSEGTIVAVFTPCFDLRSGQVIGFEASPRWRHPQLGEIPPQRFIPIAEDVGLIHEIGATLLRQACIAAKSWPTNVRLAMDVFPSRLKNRELPDHILSTLAEHRIAPERVELEITESALVQNLDVVGSVFGTLREAGVRITLDNFGTGYSTLYHLRQFKLDKVKIDRTFIAAMTSEAEKARLVTALVGLGHGLGLKIAAEGIESFSQNTSLLGNGCDEGQGNWFSDPVEGKDTNGFFDRPSVLEEPREALSPTP